MTPRPFVLAGLVAIVGALALLVASLRARDGLAPPLSRRRLRFLLPAAVLMFVAAALMIAAAVAAP